MQASIETQWNQLSDVALSTMYLGNMKPAVAEKLQSLNDIVKTEQYLDFINNRRFRSTLLCHNNVPINRSLNNNSIKNFAISRTCQLTASANPVLHLLVLKTTFLGPNP